MKMLLICEPGYRTRLMQVTSNSSLTIVVRICSAKSTLCFTAFVGVAWWLLLLYGNSRRLLFNIFLRSRILQTWRWCNLSDTFSRAFLNNSRSFDCIFRSDYSLPWPNIFLSIISCAASPFEFREEHANDFRIGTTLSPFWKLQRVAIGLCSNRRNSGTKKTRYLMEYIISHSTLASFH